MLEKYPDLLTADFPQFLAATWEFSRWTRKTVEQFPQAAGLGMCTQRYVYFYCQDPGYVFAAADNPSRFRDRVKQSHYNVHFLHQERLNADLSDFLISVGHPVSEVEPILEKSPVNVSTSSGAHARHYSPALKAEVRRADALIFELFPEYDI